MLVAGSVRRRRVRDVLDRDCIPGDLDKCLLSTQPRAVVALRRAKGGADHRGGAERVELR
jgi:hypothetical protein